MKRLLTTRDKNGASHRRSKSSEPSTKPRPLSSQGLHLPFKIESRTPGLIDGSKVHMIRQRLRDNHILIFDDFQIEYALHTKYSEGHTDKAYEILKLFYESVEGHVRPYNPSIHMEGAENRGAVTCWLDSLLFAMFARLNSFEQMLYTKFDEGPEKRLAIFIRLWVNMLRSGKLIQEDVTEQLQEAIAACGWPEAAELCQEDASEAFGFITDKLKLPLLTMEMDIFHAGKEGDDPDDHKFINERLLEVAIPHNADGNVVRLEDCLEEHFNVRVEVVRRLERRDTLKGADSEDTTSPRPTTLDEKESDVQHVENVETVDTKPMTPTTPLSPIPPTLTNSLSRTRAPSIIRHVVVPEEADGESSIRTETASVHSSIRKGSIRKEVLMPAWQFFRIIPWYTANLPTNDAQVADHFSSTRPVLGICLKRYAMAPNGEPIRQNTFVDIPLQIALPHFIQDDQSAQDGPLFGNFKLVLQSMVCHRGQSVHAGHYISVVRGTAKPLTDDTANGGRPRSDSQPPEYREDRWILFDDLATPRVTYTDIDKILTTEMPYLLFYQVQPLIDDDSEVRPPSYQDSAIAMTVQDATPVSNEGQDLFSSQSSYFESSADDRSKSRISFSDDVERPRRSLNLPDSERRTSLAQTDTSAGSVAGSTPVTPGEEGPISRLSRATSRFSRVGRSKSRPTSHVDENRISSTFSRLNLMRSKEALNKSQETSSSDVTVSVTSIESPEDTTDSVPPTKSEGDSQEGQNSNDKAKQNKQRDKSKGPEGHHHHHSIHKWKGKEKEKENHKELRPDRECSLM